MAGALDLGAPLANLNLQDSRKDLILNVLTANINKVDARDVETQKRFLEYFFQENKPDCILMQEKPWSGDNIKEHLKAIGEDYTGYARKGKMKTAVLCRSTSAPKLDMKSVLVPSELFRTFTRQSNTATILDRATIVSFTAKGYLAGRSEPLLVMISWHGEHKARFKIKKKTIQSLLRVVNHIHTKCYGRPVPVVLGGDFNFDYQKVQKIIKKDKKSRLQLRKGHVPSFRRGKKQIDFFIVTEDVEVDGVYAIPYEMDPEGETFDHVPVMARLTFPTIKMKPKDDVLVKNLEKMLSRKEPRARCMCNKTECDRNGVIHLLACRHTFHQQCLPADRSCIICTSGASSDKRPCTPGSPAHRSSVLPRVIIYPLTYMPGLITCWHLFPCHSQSGIVCSKSRLYRDIVIMLTLCRLFFDSCEIPDPYQPLSQSWIYRVIRGILIGNKLFSRLIRTAALEFEVIQKLKDALDVEPTKLYNGTLLSWKRLPELIPRAVQKPQTALICIAKETTVAFVHFSKYVLLLDTHSHGSTGALVALASEDNAGKLILWYKDFNKLNDKFKVQVRRVRYSSKRLAVAAATLFSRRQ